MNSNDYVNNITLPKRLYTEIECKVCDLFLECGITSIPIEPVKIIQKKEWILKGIENLSYVFDTHDTVGNTDGFSFFDTSLGTYVIAYDPQKPIRRIRFTLMHEIGHIDMGHKQESDLARKIADTYAAYALAPSPLIHALNCEDYTEVSNLFNISPDSAFICFQRYINWCNYSGNLKPHEIKMLNHFGF